MFACCYNSVLVSLFALRVSSQPVLNVHVPTPLKERFQKQWLLESGYSLHDLIARVRADVDAFEQHAVIEASTLNSRLDNEANRVSFLQTRVLSSTSSTKPGSTSNTSKKMSKFDLNAVVSGYKDEAGKLSSQQNVRTASTKVNSETIATVLTQPTSSGVSINELAKLAQLHAASVASFEKEAANIPSGEEALDRVRLQTARKLSTES